MYKSIRSNLQTKLILAFVVVLLIPTVMVSSYSMDRSVNAVIVSTSEQELNTATLSADHIQTFLQNMKDDLTFLQNDDGTQAFSNSLDGAADPTAKDDIERLFSNFLRSSSAHYSQVEILDKNGKELVGVENRFGSPAIIYGIDLEEAASKPYFRDAINLAQDQAYFAGLDLNVTRGLIDNPPDPVMRYSTPLYASSGKRVGVLVLKAEAGPILAVLQTDESTEATYLVDSAGDYWLNPDASKLYGTIRGTKANFNQDQPHDAATIQGKDQGIIQDSPDRPNTFETFMQIPLPDHPGAQWTLVAARPMDDILANVTQARIVAGLFAVFATIAAFALAFVRVRSIVKPIRQLTVAASEISQNHWDVQLPKADSSADEISSLTTSFGAMVEAVQDRNVKLTQLNNELSAQAKELLRANALAKESARLKSEFMSTMSHELRTPLNAILGFSGIMLQGMGGEMDEDARHMVERIDSNSQRLLGLINNVLDLAKIEAGRMELTMQPFEPRTLAEDWKAQMGILAEKKALHFEVNVDRNLPETLYGDPERITQIAVNLLSNAFKFTDRGQVILNIGRQNDKWIIRVSDTGVGIPPHALNYIFDEFRQVDGTSTRVYGGSGLGLAIVRNMCRMMDGTIKVASELTKGSVFTVTLPLITQYNFDAKAEAPMPEMA